MKIVFFHPADLGWMGLFAICGLPVIVLTGSVIILIKVFAKPKNK